MADLVSDNEEAQILWLGSVTSPQLLSDLFGVEDVHSINTQMVRRAVLTIAGMADTDSLARASYPRYPVLTTSEKPC